MEAILLCGGLGTRLRSVVSDRPKPLADVCGRAFMAYVTDALAAQGIDELVFAVGYKGGMVEEYFGDGTAFGIKASYVYEEEPLGTAGAIRNAMKKMKGERAYVLNADTYYRIDYKKLAQRMDAEGLDMALVTREVEDISRYGEVRTDAAGRLIGWNEKDTDAHRAGAINGGIYLISRALMEEIPEGKVSLENDMIPLWLKEGRRIGCVPSGGYFIDIGVPESYAQFQADVAAGRI